jgi:beta-lactamase class A
MAPLSFPETGSMPVLNRRRFVLSLAGAAATGHAVADDADASLRRALAQLESRSGGRLGVAVRQGPDMAGHRADERFAMCSTFKLPLAAAVLQRCGTGDWAPAQWVPFGSADRVPHMPVTAQHLDAGGMPLLALAEAAQRQSDNLAANLLLRRLGGPQAFNAWLRSQGDTTTRLDRDEPAMNDVPVGAETDTTTPAAMATLVARQFSDGGLDPAGRVTLRAWLVATRTGMRRLRAGVPPDWVSGDKTGTGLQPGQPDRINDVAVIWPAGRSGVWTIAAYYEGPQRGSARVRDTDQAVLAEVGRLATRWLRLRARPERLLAR